MVGFDLGGANVFQIGGGDVDMVLTSYIGDSDTMFSMGEVKLKLKMYLFNSFQIKYNFK